jgi:hypothetical protein
VHLQPHGMSQSFRAAVSVQCYKHCTANRTAGHITRTECWLQNIRETDDTTDLDIDGRKLHAGIYKKVAKERHQVLMAAGTKMTALWNAAPRSQVYVHRRFRAVCCLHNQGDEYSSVNL